MEQPHKPDKPRLEPRLVFALVMIAIPVLYVVAQTVVVRPGEACADPERREVGGVSQLFVPGVGCEREIPQRP
ncbi:MAG TPA: hypothetical protein VFZ64_02140 [Nocardioidaceae bacterium]